MSVDIDKTVTKVVRELSSLNYVYPETIKGCIAYLINQELSDNEYQEVVSKVRSALDVIKTAK